MDPMYQALSLFRRKHYDGCAEICTTILEKQPLDQAAWCLKMRALTQRVYVDDIDSEIASENDDFLDSNIVASAPRPGTSLKTAQVPPVTAAIGARPRTATGRPISGVARPRTGSGGLDRLKTARPISTQSSRTIRLGTAAMLSQQKDGAFIEVSRLNLPKYAAHHPSLARPLFEYLFYHEVDVSRSMELAVHATQVSDFKDWWWKVQLAKCYLALNLVRDGEQQLRSALKQHHHVETFVRLLKVYVRLDQPLSAIEICKAGLEIFPNDVTLMTELARIYEGLNDASASVKYYRSVVIEDAINTEAIACIGMYHFYNNQPELALRYYRRVLAIGAHSPELYNNLGLCCLYSQQLDLTLACFQRALDLAVEPPTRAEVWYNLSHLAVAAGDIELAVHCLNLSLAADPTHAPALNNLAVMQHKMTRTNFAKAYLSAARALEPNLPEPHINFEILQNAK